MDSSTQLLCVPKYSLDKVDVTQNGTHVRPVTTPEPGTERTLESVSAWRIMDTHFNIYRSMPWASNVTSINVSSHAIDVDHYTEMLILNQTGRSVELMSLLDSETLGKAASDYYSQFGAIIAKTSLLQQAKTPITGLVTFDQNCLVVRSWVAQWMAGLVVFGIVLSAILLFMVPTHPLLPSNPSTILGMASLLAHSGDVMNCLRSAGFADDNSLARCLRYSTFQSSCK